MQSHVQRASRRVNQNNFPPCNREMTFIKRFLTSSAVFASYSHNLRNMHRLFKSALLICFFFGVVLYPAWHRADCAFQSGASTASHQHESGDADGHAYPPAQDSHGCPVCQLAVTPLIGSAIVLAPVAVILAWENIVFPVDLPSSWTLSNLHFARGPPSA
jgi:hypothetical protein